MSNIYLQQYVEMPDCYVEVSDGGFSYNGEVDVEFEYEFNMSAEEIVECCTDVDKSALKEALGCDDEVQEMDVADIYENLTEGSKAYLFNKLLKNKDYNPNGSSVVKLQEAMQRCMVAQDKEV